MSKELNKKKEKKEVNALTYLKRVKIIGILGIIVSIILFGYDIYNYNGWLSIVSFVIDGILLCFSIYFIVKSIKLKKREVLANEKSLHNSVSKKSKK